MIKDFNIEEFKKDCEESELDFDSLLEKIKDFDSKRWALFEHVGEKAYYVEDIALLDIDDSEIDFDGERLLILADDEADYLADSYLDNEIEDCVLCNIPANLQRFFDCEAYKEEILSYGRGGVLSSYDGNEEEQRIEYEDGTEETIYIYRQ